ncbi:MAG: GtrA family protein [Devosia sp.]|uniref:GtrA family protein n=1 Tax=Devosia sp. TaxID=1871048 RepID=UPI0024C888E1|nr:GtrA family protein [Devosia sp.]UYO01102.1 MAG: GtrA family protein [Devosia sp.]
MSIALQSLMRQPTTGPAPAPRSASLMSFLAIGAGGAIGFVIVSGLLVGLVPQEAAWIVSAACYCAFILPVYLLHRRFSFASEAEHARALPRYAGVQAMAMLLAAAFGYVFHGALTLPSLPAALLVVALTSGVNFVVLKSWAFAVARPDANAIVARAG